MSPFHALALLNLVLAVLIALALLWVWWGRAAALSLVLGLAVGVVAALTAMPLPDLGGGQGPPSGTHTGPGVESPASSAALERHAQATDAASRDLRAEMGATTAALKDHHRAGAEASQGLHGRLEAIERALRPAPQLPPPDHVPPALVSIRAEQEKDRLFVRLSTQPHSLGVEVTEAAVRFCPPSGLATPAACVEPQYPCDIRRSLSLICPEKPVRLEPARSARRYTTIPETVAPGPAVILIHLAADGTRLVCRLDAEVRRRRGQSSLSVTSPQPWSGCTPDQPRAG